MKRMIYWITNPLRYRIYRLRLKQGLSPEYSYNFVSEHTIEELRAWLLTTRIEQLRGI